MSKGDLLNGWIYLVGLDHESIVSTHFLSISHQKTSCSTLCLKLGRRTWSIWPSIPCCNEHGFSLDSTVSNQTPFLPASTLALHARSHVLRHPQCYLLSALGEPTLLEHDTGQLVCEVLLPTDLAFYGIQEHHWLGSSEFKVEGYSFFYSSHRDLAHEGVALVLSPSVAGNLLAQLAMSPASCGFNCTQRRPQALGYGVLCPHRLQWGLA